jgi:hypothetical protein
VTPPDFEIDVGLRARDLVAHVPPDARTDTSSADVSLEREGARIGLPPNLEPAGRYCDVVVVKRMVGKVGAAADAQDGGVPGG